MEPLGRHYEYNLQKGGGSAPNFLGPLAVLG